MSGFLARPRWQRTKGYRKVKEASVNGTNRSAGREDTANLQILPRLPSQSQHSHVPL